MNLLYKKDIEIAKDALIKGDIIAFPTDTVFGLACIYDNENAINKIYEAKGRSFNKPLPMMCRNITEISKYAKLNKKAKVLFKKYSPGAITLILKKKNLPDFISPETDTIAIRIPDDKWILKLIKLVGKPLLVTSANISNEDSLSDYKDVLKAFGDNIDYIVRGKSKSIISSTIIDLSNDLKLIRQGDISFEDIKETLNENII